MNNIHATFLRMELEEKLFDLKDSGKIFYWDIIRQAVFAAIHSKRKVSDSRKKRNSPLNILKNKIKSFYNILFKSIYNFYRPEVVVLSFPRVIIGGENIDPITIEMINNLRYKILIIQCASKYSIKLFRFRRSETDARLYIPNLMFPSLSINEEMKSIARIINSHIKNYFGYEVYIDDLVHEYIGIFRYQSEFYKSMFRNSKPRLVICNNDNTMKGIFYSCKEFDIKTIEPQHGISPQSIMWTYPKGLSYESRKIYTPHTFFTFSQIWSEMYDYPSREKVVIGNGFYYNSDKYLSDDTPDGILIIANKSTNEKLIEFTTQLSSILSKRIYYKLHPEQYCERKTISERFMNNRNVTVVTNEYTVPGIMTRVDAVIGVRSTMLYSALHLKKSVYVLSVGNYLWDHFILRFATTVKDANDFVDLYLTPEPTVKKVNENIFCEFDVGKFQSVIRNLVCD